MKVFITGGTTGIGLELAKVYLADGHDVAVCGRDIRKIPSEIRTKYPQLKTYQVDVRDLKNLKDSVNEFCQGKLDLIIANAGISTGKGLGPIDFEKTREVLSINTFGVINAFEAGLENMIPHKNGQLVAISSIAGLVGLPWAGAYSSSKAAVLTLCESYSIHLRKMGLRVSVVAPGFVDTPLTRSNKYFMPWLMEAPKAANKIKNALNRKKERFIFPWQMRILMAILNKMPRGLYRYLLRLNFTIKKV